MAAILQPISDYTVVFSHNQVLGPPVSHARTRFLHLRFGTDTTKLNLLILGFVPDTASASTGEITKLPNGTYRVSARVPVADYAAYADLLRNEKPVSVRIDYPTEPATNQSVPLTNLTLFSGVEPLGEGPADTSI